MSTNGSDYRYYITTSIPYVNAVPHIGHALEFVQTDTFARYHRLVGNDTRFLTGTDENSLTNVLAAEREGMPVAELVERNAAAFLRLTDLLDVSNDDFIRTAAEERHLAGCRKLWEACDRNGDIYRRHYRGLYCVRCEQFYTEEELDDGLCPEHHIPVEVVEEENYFFRLSRYGDRLAQLIDSGALRIIPETRRNEVRSFIARGLEDFSISRSRSRARGWGIPVPGDPDQVMYVWFDALANYITAPGYATDADLYRRFWLENPRRVHVIGKGILRFHAVYWPAMLLSAGLPLPTTVFVHGYLTIAGEKMSKSLGNVVDPAELVARYGTEPVRYWLLREVPPTGDADYTDEKLERRYNADLANDLGNLLNRTVTMIRRYRDGAVPAPAAPDAVDQDLELVASSLAGRLAAAVGQDYDPQSALAAVWELVVRANRYVEETAPWALARGERSGDHAAAGRLDGALYHLAESLRLIAQALRPFLPGTADRIAAQLGVVLVETPWTEALGWGVLAPGTQVGEPQPIFPKLDVPTPHSA
ncbi:MAG TPA: class I tRNA ligase family protein [Thermomicrobiaceae bacterium]|nr:class I tRNA ligase family protein [Thermomicrobiaceae bacterium]